jgi:probable rRNA maturation factor
MTVDVMIEDARWRAAGLEALAETAAHATLTHLGLDPEAFEICVLACNDSRIAALNADFRGKPQATNVLSWPSEDRAADRPGLSPARPAPGGDPELGDIAIAYDTCAAEASAAAKPFAAHVSHLIVHGVLHLLGYDHIDDKDGDLMEGIETAILGKMGLPDPYCSDDTPDDLQAGRP